MKSSSKKFTHNLIKYSRFDLSYDYICTVCGIELYKAIFDEEYFLLNEGHLSTDYYEYNCNEWIIKNIVE